MDIPNNSVDSQSDNTQESIDAQYKVVPIPIHQHTGMDSSQVDIRNIDRFISTPAQGDIPQFSTVSNKWVPISMGTQGSILYSTGTKTTYLSLGTQGSVLYSDGSKPTYLTPGTSGQFLKTQGNGANPVWGTVSSGFVSGVIGTNIAGATVNVNGSNQTTICTVTGLPALGANEIWGVKLTTFGVSASNVRVGISDTPNSYNTGASSGTIHGNGTRYVHEFTLINLNSTSSQNYLSTANASVAGVSYSSGEYDTTPVSAIATGSANWTLYVVANFSSGAAFNLTVQNVVVYRI